MTLLEKLVTVSAMLTAGRVWCVDHMHVAHVSVGGKADDCSCYADSCVCLVFGGHVHVAHMTKGGKADDSSCYADNCVCSVGAKAADLAVLLLLKLCFVAINKLLHPHLELL